MIEYWIVNDIIISYHMLLNICYFAIIGNFNSLKFYITI